MAKSAFAERAGTEAREGDAVLFIATAEPGDEEMEARNSKASRGTSEVMGHFGGAKPGRRAASPVGFADLVS